MTEIGYGAAFLAGLLSFFSPCVLPLLPVYIALISGVSAESLKAGEHSAFWLIVSRAALFVLGFSVVFTALGVGAGALGQILRSDDFRIHSGALLILLGLHLTGLVQITALHRISQLGGQRRTTGAVGAFLFGIIVVPGWMACIGPILGSILMLAANEDQVGQATRLLMVYSAGLGIPFLLASAAMGAFLKATDRVKRLLSTIEIINGVLLISIGWLLLTDRFTVLAQWFSSLYTPAF